MREKGRDERRKGERRGDSPGASTGPERRSGKERRKSPARHGQRMAAAQATSLIPLIVILAIAFGALHYWGSSPANARLSEELTQKFTRSGVSLIVVEGRGVCVYLGQEQMELAGEDAEKHSPLLSDIAGEYRTSTGKGSVTLYVYVSAKLTHKTKL